MTKIQKNLTSGSIALIASSAIFTGIVDLIYNKKLNDAAISCFQKDPFDATCYLKDPSYVSNIDIIQFMSESHMAINVLIFLIFFNLVFQIKFFIDSELFKVEKTIKKLKLENFRESSSQYYGLLGTLVGFSSFLYSKTNSSVNSIVDLFLSNFSTIILTTVLGAAVTVLIMFTRSIMKEQGE
ncbi:MAG: hypothetical protein U9N59_16765 [Campylobacterota bacterium]|nr:hypothetical protein [Campylobacterota bacterium]